MQAMTISEGLPRPALRAFLAYTPQAHPPTAPHPALPYLKAALGQALPAVSVDQKDLDAIYYAHVFDSAALRERFPPGRAAAIRAAYEAQQDPAAYRDIPRFLESHALLEGALADLSRQHRERTGAQQESLTLRGNTFTYVSDFPSNRRNGVLAALEPGNRERNIFYAYYRDHVLPHILAEGYGAVGLSVFLRDQVIPAFLLASLIKEQRPETAVILGGNYLTRFPDILSRDDALNRALFQSVDAIALKEGEQPLTEILARLASGDRDLSGINQVISRNANGAIEMTLNQSKLAETDMEALPRPDFDGIFTSLDGERAVHWTPSPVIALYTQRGCAYANGCDFCTIMSANNNPGSRQARSAEAVADDIASYQARYGSRVFSFGNETLPRQFMAALSAALHARGIEATIDGYTRTDQLTRAGAVDLDLIRAIRPYFRFLQVGFESNDAETLASMRKGRKPVSDSALVHALFENGIVPHAFLLLGFPPPASYAGKDADAYRNFYFRSSLRTLRWLSRNRSSIGTFIPTTLMIPRDDRKMLSEDGIHPAYAHELVLEEPQELDFNVPYRKRNGSRRLDEQFRGLLELVGTPYQEYTHSTIYHQRLFNWEEGIAWSRSRPERTAPERQLRERSLLQRLWNEAVGTEYRDATTELRKRGGLATEKRERLEALRARIWETNSMAHDFPEGIPSIEALLALPEGPSAAPPGPQRGRVHYLAPLTAAAAALLLGLSLGREPDRDFREYAQGLLVRYSHERPALGGDLVAYVGQGRPVEALESDDLHRAIGLWMMDSTTLDLRVRSKDPAHAADYQAYLAFRQSRSTPRNG